MPFQIEIHTLAGSFVTTAPEDCQDPLKWADEIIKQGWCFTLDDGSLWQPWNPDHIVALVQVPDFPAVNSEPDDAWELTGKGLSNPIATPWDGPIGCICTWNDHVAYVGKSYSAIIYTIQDSEGRAYFLLYTIDGAAARDMISDDGQKKFIQAWLSQCHGGPSKEYTLVLPHEAIYDPEEAQTFLKDYVRENQGEYKPKEKTGKAWHGWIEGGRA